MFEDYKVGMISGGDCTKILQKRSIILKKMKASRLEMQIWDKMQRIVELMEMDSSQLGKIADLQWKKEQQLIDSWWDDLGKRYLQRNDVYIFYFHIIKHHLIDMLKKHGTLSIFSNQGFENSHTLHKKVWKRTTSIAKGESIILQILLWQCRILYICCFGK